MFSLGLHLLHTQEVWSESHRPHQEEDRTTPSGQDSGRQTVIIFDTCNAVVLFLAWRLQKPSKTFLFVCLCFPRRLLMEICWVWIVGVGGDFILSAFDTPPCGHSVFIPSGDTSYPYFWSDYKLIIIQAVLKKTWIRNASGSNSHIVAAAMCFMLGMTHKIQFHNLFLLVSS